MDANQSHHQQRLNPFTFPVETDARFRLLLVAAVALTFMITLPLVELVGFLGAFNAVLICPGGFVVLLLGLATYFYRNHPQQIRQQKKLVPADIQKDAALLAIVHELAAKAGVVPPPTVEFDLQGGPDGQAFGFAGQPVLRLSKGARLYRLKQPAAFRALVLHEVSHLVNHDVYRTYFSEALWKAFLLVVCLSIPGHWLRTFLQGVDTIGVLAAAVIALLMLLLVGGEIGVIILCVGTIRRGVLQVREFYADWRAATLGADSELRAMLQRNAEKTALSVWHRLTRFHPSATQRLNVLINPDLLFRVSGDLPFTAAFLMGILFTGVLSLLIWFYEQTNSLTSDGSSFLIGVIMVVMLGFLYLCVGVLIDTVGLQVMREGVADLVYDRRGFGRYANLMKPALLMTLGFEIGVILTPYDRLTATNPLSGMNPSPPLATALFLVVDHFLLIQGIISTLLWLVNWGGLILTRYLARCILGSHVGAQLPQRRIRRVLLRPQLWFLCMYMVVLTVPLVLNDTLPMMQWAWLSVSLFILAGVVLTVILLGIVAQWLTPQPPCPHCRAKINFAQLRKANCSFCGRDLQAWLFLDQPLPGSAHELKIITTN